MAIEEAAVIMIGGRVLISSAACIGHGVAPCHFLFDITRGCTIAPRTNQSREGRHPLFIEPASSDHHQPAVPGAPGR